MDNLIKDSRFRFRSRKNTFCCLYHSGSFVWIHRISWLTFFCLFIFHIDSTGIKRGCSKNQNSCGYGHPEFISGSVIQCFEILKQFQDEWINDFWYSLSKY